LRLVEHYVSMQGECDRTGTPTQFIRFAGCNLKCTGWPCDTPFAIFPRQYLKKQYLLPVHNPGSASLMGDIIDKYDETGAGNICLTGGEPLLQLNDDLDDLITNALHLQSRIKSIEMFSNGTLRYTHTMLEKCSIRMDWKLPGSHEDQSGPNWDVRIENYCNMGEWNHHTIKFTIKDQFDFETAMSIFDKYGLETWPGTVYAGPVWDSEYTAADISAGILANKLPWRLNVQTHNYIWPAQERER